MGILATIKFNPIFKHSAAQVDYIQSDTEKYLRRLQEEVKRIRLIKTDISDRDIFFHAARYDGIPVEPKLALLCDELRAANHRIKFGMRQDCASRRITVVKSNPDGAMFGSSGSYSLLCELWVYLPEQPYALMRIGYKNYATTAHASDDPTYGIYSRLIQNRKYNTDNAQHCMLMSADVGRAVKNARSVMRPYAPQETAQVKLDFFTSAVQNETANFNVAVHNTVSEVRKNTDLMRELVHLLESGHEFLSVELKQQVQAYVGARVMQKEHISKVRHGWFVTVLTRKDVQHFNVIEMFDVHKSPPVMHDPQTFTAETMPEELTGKMAVLSMVDVGTRVSDVGMRATETTFYVERV